MVRWGWADHLGVWPPSEPVGPMGRRRRSCRQLAVAGGSSRWWRPCCGAAAVATQMAGDAHGSSAACRLIRGQRPCRWSCWRGATLVWHHRRQWWGTAGTDGRCRGCQSCHHCGQVPGTCGAVVAAKQLFNSPGCWCRHRRQRCPCSCVEMSLSVTAPVDRLSSLLHSGDPSHPCSKTPVSWVFCELPQHSTPWQPRVIAATAQHSMANSCHCTAAAAPGAICTCCSASGTCATTAYIIVEGPWQARRAGPRHHCHRLHRHAGGHRWECAAAVAAPLLSQRPQAFTAPNTVRIQRASSATTARPPAAMHTTAVPQQCRFPLCPHHCGPSLGSLPSSNPCHPKLAVLMRHHSILPRLHLIRWPCCHCCCCFSSTPGISVPFHVRTPAMKALPPHRTRAWVWQAV